MTEMDERVAPDRLAEALTDYFGERCPDHGEYCPCCQAWEQYDQQATLSLAIRRALGYLGKYLPPDGISSKECISGVLGALDNEQVKKALEDGK